MMSKPFEGIRVLDFGMNIAGPNTCALLSDFGAEVIKVEQPGIGDANRSFRPYLEGKSLANIWLNRGKRSLAIPLGDPQAHEVLLRLVKEADVMLQTFRPGIIEKFGLGYDDVKKINPGIIYCSISTFGTSGKLAHFPGYDLLAQAMCGAMHMTGRASEPPNRLGVSLYDYAASFNAFGGIAMALYHRKCTGIGQHVEVGLFNVGVHMIGGPLEAVTTVGADPMRSGDHMTAIAPYGTYHSRHGSIVIIAGTQKLWETLCSLIGRPELADDPKYSTNEARCLNIDSLVDHIEGWLNTFGDMETPMEKLLEAGIPCSKILSFPEVVELADRDGSGQICDLELPDEYKTKRSIRARNVPISLSETPGKMGLGGGSLGKHTAEILRELGYSEEETGRMIAQWENNVKT